MSARYTDDELRALVESPYTTENQKSAARDLLEARGEH